MRPFKKGFFAVCMSLVVLCTMSLLPTNVTYAATTSDNSTYGMTKEQMYLDMANYKTNLGITNTLKSETVDKLEALYASAHSYIANSSLALSDLNTYENNVKAEMDKIVANQGANDPASTKEFLVVGDNCATPVATHGQKVTVIVPILNLGTEGIKDIVVTPVTSASVKEWPFAIEKTSYSEIVPELPANKTKEEAIVNRREVQYTFTTREDVLSGYYKLTYNVTYSLNNKIETTTLTTYVQAVGAKGSGTVEGSAEDTGKSSTPRIIVTGFETNPAEVFAGDTFKLIIHVKNTSQRTNVSNVEFDLEAAQEGKDTTTTYSAFLPTSGSNTVYVDTLASNGTTDLQIEMTAKADLAQKPYVLNIKMKYEDDKYNPYEGTASVSIPIKQESKFETSTPEIMPTEITVGSQSNVMFSIYNTGKTVLYNTQVKFIGDSVTGGDTFVGKIDSGGTGNVDAMLTGAVATTDDGVIKVQISYENESGKVTTEEKEINLLVSDASADMGMPVDEMPIEEPKAGNSKGILIGVAIAIVIIIVVVVVLLKKKKKKKMAKELEEDLMGIDETSDIK